MLTVDQQNMILGELDHVLKSSQASASVEPGTPKQPTERPLWNTNSDAQNAVAAPAAAQSQILKSSSAHHTQMQASEQYGSGAALHSEATTSSSAAVEAVSGTYADSRAGTSTSGTQEGPGQFGWYGDLSGSLSKWWQQVMACSVLAGIKFCKKRNFATKEHCLGYTHWTRGCSRARALQGCHHPK